MNVITERYSLYLGDCLEVMKTFEANSIDTVICDPPYGLSFMGKNWDHGIPGVPFWAEMLRVAKPGAILMAFGGTRTHHRLMVAIEDAGWELRDTIMWLYGSGFPKALNISAAIDAHLGAERETLGYKPSHRPNRVGHQSGSLAAAYTDAIETAPATDAAKEFGGYFSALKPAWEPIIVAMKPLTSTFAANALAHGVAGLNIDGTRIQSDERPLIQSNRRNGNNTYGNGLYGSYHAGETTQGRWPANLILSQSAAALLDEMSGITTVTGNRSQRSQERDVPGTTWGNTNHKSKEYPNETPSGASRYFTVLPDSEPRFCYTAKASNSERSEGLDDLPEQSGGTYDGNADTKNARKLGARPDIPVKPTRNGHPTVKPLSLMRWLVRLTKTPTGGDVLDPFGGSGTTGVACLLEGRKVVLIDKIAEYFEIMRHRMEHWQDEASTEPRKLRGKDSDLSGMPLFADIGG